MADRDPWSFHMFLYKMDTKEVSVRFKKAGGQWIDFPVAKRMKFAASDNDIYGLVKYVFKTEPEASKVEIKLSIRQNDFLIQKDALATINEQGVLSIKIDSTCSPQSQLKQY